MAKRDAAKQPTAPPLDARDLEQISAGLDRALDRAEEETAQIDDPRSRSSAFAYAAALGYHLESGNRLCATFRRAERFDAVSAPRPAAGDLVEQVIAGEGP